MAVVWKSRGTVGPASTDVGVDLPLALIEERLIGYQVFFRGEVPRTIAPETTHFEYVIVEVTLGDEPTPSFVRSGYYLILGLHPDDAAFLFEQPPVD